MRRHYDGEWQSFPNWQYAFSRAKNNPEKHLCEQDRHWQKQQQSRAAKQEFKQIDQPLRPSRFNHGGNAHRYAVVGNIVEHYGVCTDHHIVANRNRTQNLGPRSNIHIVADNRGTRLIYSPKAHDDAVAYPTIIAEFGIPTDDNSTEVINDKIATNWYFAWQINAGEYLAQFVKNPVEQGKKFSQRPRPDSETPPAKSINHEHPESLCAPIAAVCL